MKKLLARVILVLPFILGPCHAAEAAAGEEQTVLMKQSLNNLRDISGIHGASVSEMNDFLDMVNTPEMAKVVERLHTQLLSRFAAGENDLESVNDFVRQNLTLEDAEKILGQVIDPEDMQKALAREVKQEDMENLLRILRDGK